MQKTVLCADMEWLLQMSLHIVWLFNQEPEYKIG